MYIFLNALKVIVCYYSSRPTVSMNENTDKFNTFERFMEKEYIYNYIYKSQN